MNVFTLENYFLTSSYFFLLQWTLGLLEILCHHQKSHVYGSLRNYTQRHIIPLQYLKMHNMVQRKNRKVKKKPNRIISCIF